MCEKQEVLDLAKCRMELNVPGNWDDMHMASIELGRNWREKAPEQPKVVNVVRQKPMPRATNSISFLLLIVRTACFQAETAITPRTRVNGGALDRGVSPADMLYWSNLRHG